MPRSNLCRPNMSNEEKYRHSQNTYISEYDLTTRNKNFIQYYDSSFIYRNLLIEEDATAFRVFDFFARFCDNNNTIIVSKKEIAEVLNKSEKTIQRALRKLENYNFLTTIRFGQYDYVYFLNPMVTANAKAEYKSKWIDTYFNITGTLDIKMQIDNDAIDKLNKFAQREKIGFKFANKNVAFQPPTTDEQIKKINKLEQLDIDETQKTEETKKHEYDYLDNDEFSANTTVEIFENIRKNLNIEDDEQF